MNPKVKAVRLTVESLTAVKLNEKKDDEIYFEVATKYDGRDQVVVEHFPEGKKPIKFLLNETKTLNIQLYKGMSNTGVALAVQIFERDAKGILSFLHEMDDIVGSFNIFIATDGNIDIKSPDHTILLPESSNSKLKFDFKGSECHYVGNFLLEVN